MQEFNSVLLFHGTPGQSRFGEFLQDLIEAVMSMMLTCVREKLSEVVHLQTATFEAVYTSEGENH